MKVQEIYCLYILERNKNRKGAEGTGESNAAGVKAKSKGY